MRNRCGRLALTLLACLSLVPIRALAQTLSPPFDEDYTAVSLGSVPGVPTNYGGLTFLPGDPDTIVIGGSANQAGGLLYTIQVERDEEDHIVGFAGTASRFAEAPYNDGGVTFGPSGVLFLARWPVNELGQLEPGSETTDKVIDMDTFGVTSSLSALAFVPPGFPGAGRLKLVTYSGGNWYDAGYEPDGGGTFDLVDVELRVQIQGGPEGFVYVPPASPRFEDFSSILVAEYSGGQIAAYEVDDDGDPIVATRQTFLTGLSGAEGAVVDPLTGDFLFSTFGGSNRVVAVRGFGAPASCGGRCATGPGCEDTCDIASNECRSCGHPFRNDRCIANAVFVLQGSLALRDCELCTCDVDSSGTVVATDALIILRSCVNPAVDLDCTQPAAFLP